VGGNCFSLSVALFLRILHRRYTTVIASTAPTPTPAPIPAFALVDIPAGSSADAGVLDAELDADASLVVVTYVDADVTKDDASEVAGAGVEVASSMNTVPTTVYLVALRSHVAHTFGLDGRTANLPTPLLQQPGL
jgi:hypothetical protein